MKNCQEIRRRLLGASWAPSHEGYSLILDDLTTESQRGSGLVGGTIELGVHKKALPLLNPQLGRMRVVELVLHCLLSGNPLYDSPPNFSTGCSRWLQSIGNCLVNDLQSFVGKRFFERVHFAWRKPKSTLSYVLSQVPIRHLIDFVTWQAYGILVLVSGLGTQRYRCDYADWTRAGWFKDSFDTKVASECQPFLIATVMP